ncbi:MAG: NADH-dependent alcohol dehydrogenase [Acidobacteria bacterium]|nr:MAG: NADH-dependent alcohol dehydrogenase [Acidobacteriota bacterium]
MLNFSFYNPTKIIFGNDSIGQIASEIPVNAKVMMIYGMGSIKRNGVYNQVIQALSGFSFIEFGGIEPNPEYETLMKAVLLARSEKVDFLLAVGGGSVVDGTKFIAAAIPFKGSSAWDMMNGAPVHSAIPLGCVLTLPATGSESNSGAIISNREKQLKCYFGSTLCFPVFSVLDPSTTVTLDQRQTVNGIVDAFVHVLEQYLTYPVNNPLQDRFSEGILKTLIEEGPKVISKPDDVSARANVMWCCTLALNGLIGCGVPSDWATHYIGHELTAFYGVDHAQSLAIVLPGLLRHQLQGKHIKLAQYSRRIWQLQAPLDSIEATEVFFRQLGMKTRLSEYGITEGLERIGERFRQRKIALGEHRDILPDHVDQILQSRI